MNGAVKEFFSCGRKFRARHSTSTDVILVESDELVRGMIKRWAQALEAPVWDFSDVHRAQESMNSSPRCVIVGLDELELSDCLDLLDAVEQKHPQTVSVVYSSNNMKVDFVQSNFPRVTTIRKGEALEELLVSFESEILEKSK